MKKHLIKPVLASLLLVGCVSAHAAHFEVVGYNASSRYTGTVDFTPFNYDGSYTSGGADYGTQVSAFETTADYEHSGLASGSFLGGSYLDLSTSVTFKTPTYIEYYGIATAVEKTIQLKVVADAGDIGPNVMVSFSGLSSTANLLAGAEGTFQSSIRVLQGSNVLANFNTKQFADQNVNFAFSVLAGDTVTLSASQGVHMNAIGPIDASLTGSLSGNFTVTAVPEPEQYAMLLAGLGLIAGIARRRS